MIFGKYIIGVNGSTPTSAAPSMAIVSDALVETR